MESWTRVENPITNKMLEFGYCEFTSLEGLKIASKLLNNLDIPIIFKFDSTLQIQINTLNVAKNEIEMKRQINNILENLKDDKDVKRLERELSKEKALIDEEEMRKKREILKEKEKLRKEKEKNFEIERERRSRKKLKEDRSFHESEKEWISKEKRKIRELKVEEERDSKEKELRTLLFEYKINLFLYIFFFLTIQNFFFLKGIMYR